MIGAAHTTAVVPIVKSQRLLAVNLVFGMVEVNDQCLRFDRVRLVGTQQRCKAAIFMPRTQEAQAQPGLNLRTVL